MTSRLEELDEALANIQAALQVHDAVHAARRRVLDALDQLIADPDSEIAYRECVTAKDALEHANTRAKEWVL